MPASKTVLFVCEHGALRSRIAAAFFNAAPPAGWRARSAGQSPQERLSPVLEVLLTGTAAIDVLELDAPIAASAGIELTIAIDCDAPANQTWVLDQREADAGMRDEIQARVAVLTLALNSTTQTL